jgi:arginase
MKTFHLIPYTCGAGARQTGCVAGPAALKNYGLEKYLSNEQREVIWQEDPVGSYEQVKSVYENLPPLGSKERAQIVLDQCRHISGEVEKAVKRGAVPVTIGGDHSMAAGSIAGFARANNAHGRIGLIWIDAHADINTMRTSPSQALHGMPVAALMRLRMIDPEFSRIGGSKRVLEPNHLVYAGLRNLDEMEKVRVRKHHISAFSMDMNSAVESETFIEAIGRIASETDYLVLSFDIDVMDPSVAPSVGSPEAGGFQREQILSLLGDVVASHPLDMIEITEFNPSMPGAEQTYEIIRDVSDTLLR